MMNHERPNTTRTDAGALRSATLHILAALALAFGWWMPARPATAVSRVITEVPANLLKSGSKPLICGTGLSDARAAILANGQRVAIFEYGKDRSGCWMFTPPYVADPSTLNGPVALDFADGIITSTDPITVDAAPYFDGEWDAWLPSGKYRVYIGPNLSAATAVTFAGSLLSAGDYYTLGTSMLMIPIDQFGSSYNITVQTPGGSASRSSTSPIHKLLWNGLALETPGFFAINRVDVRGQGKSSLSTYRTRYDGDSQKERFLSSHSDYVDTGVGPVLGMEFTDQVSNVVTAAPTLVGPQTVMASGWFTSGETGRRIEWTSIGTLPEFSQEYVYTMIFTETSGQPLGTLKYVSRMDEDVWSTETDMIAPHGTPGDPEFVVYTPDQFNRVGFGLKGIYTTTPGLLENFRWQGFAAGEYLEISDRVEDRTQTFSTSVEFSSTGNFHSGELNAATVEAGEGWYEDKIYKSSQDIGAAMAWTADPTATTARLTHILLNKPYGRQANSNTGIDGLAMTSAGTEVTRTTAWVSSTLFYTAPVALPAERSNVILTPTLSYTDVQLAQVQVTPKGKAPVLCSLNPITCPLEPGVNDVKIVVLSASLQKYKAYNVQVRRYVQEDATLSGLSIHPGTLAPAFVSGTHTYTAVAPSGTSTVLVTATAKSVNATVAYASSAGPCAPGNASPSSCAVAGPKTWITVTVTADATTTETYFIQVMVPEKLTTISQVWPNLGVPEGGMPVSLFGTGFLAAEGVRVSNTITNVLAPFTITSDGRIDFIMPAGVDGTTADITVETANDAKTVAQAFRYMAPAVVEFDGQAGAVITTPNGITITVPPQGVDGMFVITITPQTPEPGVPGSVLMHVFRLDATRNWVPLSQLTNPITISLPVDPAIVPAGETPYLWEWTGDGGPPTVNGGLRTAVSGQWSFVPGQSYDAVTKQVTVALKPMGLYALSTTMPQAPSGRKYYLPMLPVVR